MQRIGIVGLGFMGKMHFEVYQALKGKAKVVAICDVDPKKRAGDWSAIGGNIAGDGSRIDLSGIRMYDNFARFLKDPELDIVDVTLPTSMHMKHVLAALKAKKHVICEKPMARTAAEAMKMAAAAKAARRHLFIAQCIRFWPEYEAAKAIVDSGKYGKVKTACFRRFSTLVTWGWKNWFQDAKMSGLAALDLHIHDSDFVAHLFGKPKAVTSFGHSPKKGHFDHIITRFHYADSKFVTAEGAWEYAPTFPFRMTFAIHMEKASLTCFAGDGLILHHMNGKKDIVKVANGSGYGRELAHFLDCIERGKPSPVVTPESAAFSVKLALAEIESATTGKTIKV